MSRLETFIRIDGHKGIHLYLWTVWNTEKIEPVNFKTSGDELSPQC